MDSEGISDRKVEIRVRKNGRKDKVIVEQSAAEGLPEGWIKKLELTIRTGRKIRRDPFFIDPKSGYIFQSFRDASRYVETGRIGNYARKLKESTIEEDASENGKIALPRESLDLTSGDNLLEKEKINIYVRSSKRRNLSSSDEHPENCELNSDLSNVTSQVLEDLGKKDEAKDTIENQPVAKRVTRSQAKVSKNEEDLDLKRKTPSSSNGKPGKDTVKSRLRSASSQDLEKESVMKEEEVQDSTEKRITRSKAKVKKNELSNSVTRRASKRLAGIELDPTPELKTRTKAQRVVPLDDCTVGAGIELEPTPELKTRTKAERVVPLDDCMVGAGIELEPMPEPKTKPKAERVVPLDDGMAGKCKQPVNPVAVFSLKKPDTALNKEVAKSLNEHSSPKLNDAATSNNGLSAEMEVQIEKISKPVGRNGSGDKKKMKMPLVISEFELNPVFHLEGYKQNEEMSPVSPLSRQTSATKREKTAAGKRLGLSSPKANKVTSPKASEISPWRSLNKGKHPFDDSNAIQSRNKVSDDSSRSSVVRGTCSEAMEKNTTSSFSAFDSTLADMWKDPCIAFAIQTLTGESLHLPNTTATSSDPKNNHAKQKGIAFFPDMPGKVNLGSEKPGFSSELPGADIWKDPCIDFAIKTLTGVIPIGLDEADAKAKSERMTITAATQEENGRQSSCDHMVQQCSNKRKNKTVGKSGELRFT
ncbi:hypothetical protein AALP_AA8G299600 [Arabis alpina]|uniref:MBD domain-containing protein n=1 Tax=Arabis alpina TaxID=50452 RepID=A0A087GAD0_ARAAL|nr:hypothetical protein AALP_AA8G299600 [Arabis alpina]